MPFFVEPSLATVLDASTLFPDDDETVPLPLETGAGGNCNENQNEDAESAGEERHGELLSGGSGGGVSCGDASAPPTCESIVAKFYTKAKLLSTPVPNSQYQQYVA